MSIRYFCSVLLAALLLTGCGISPQDTAPKTPPTPSPIRTPEHNNPDDPDSGKQPKTSPPKVDQEPTHKAPPVNTPKGSSEQAPPNPAPNAPKDTAPPNPSPINAPLGGPAVDSTHAKVELVAQAWQYRIKASVNQPTFVMGDSSELSTELLQSFTQNHMAGLAYVILPEQHWFINDNPFAAEADRINLKRLMLWDNELVIVKREHNCVLLGKKQPDQPYTIKEYDPNVLFPNFTAQKIGQGGEGVVFSVAHHGKLYALKEKAAEWRDMERLFFTGGVLEIYGYFKHQNQLYMLMPMGIKSLEKSIEDGNDFMIKERDIDDLTQTQIVAGRLGIYNSDIKPANIIITQQGPKFIDISSITTQGYKGAGGLKLLQTLLEGLSRKSFRGGELPLYEYYDREPGYRKDMIASVDFMKYFFSFVCRTHNLLIDCSTVDDFYTLYHALPQQKLNELAQAINDREHDSSGTKETLGVYGTRLDFPELLDPKTINYTPYFEKRETIIDGFCLTITCAKFVHTGVSPFFKKLLERKPHYVDSCKENPATKVPFLLEQLTDPNAQAFKDFVFDAFLPNFQRQIFQQLARTVNRPQIIQEILEVEGTRLGLSDVLKNKLKHLLTIP